MNRYLVIDNKLNKRHSYTEDNLIKYLKNTANCDDEEIKRILDITTKFGFTHFIDLYKTGGTKIGVNIKCVYRD